MKVAIVGLGMAGLRAAMLLQKAGAEVSLFEARGRPGGRLHTIDEGEGAVYEAGGEWVDSAEKIEVKYPYNGEPLATVASADENLIERSLAAAALAAKKMRDLPRFVKLIEKGRLDAKSMITKTYRLADGRQAVQDVADRTVITAVILFE